MTSPWSSIASPLLMLGCTSHISSLIHKPKHMQDKIMNINHTNYAVLTFSFRRTCSRKKKSPYKNIHTVTWYIRPAYAAFTCNELSMANVHANMSVFFSSANGPMIHVRPRSGSRITVLFTVVLFERFKVTDLEHSSLCRYVHYKHQILAILATNELLPASDHAANCHH